MKRLLPLAALAALAGCGDNTDTAAPRPATTTTQRAACDPPTGQVIAAIKSKLGGREVDARRASETVHGKTHYVAVPFGENQVALVSYKDDADYLAGMVAVNGTARTATTLPDANTDEIPQAGEQALGCAQ